MESDGIQAAFDALERAGFNVKNRATGDVPPVIPTGFPVLNELLRCGGVPRRRYIQIYGEPHQGKTLLAMHIAAMAQRDQPHRVVMYIDTENTFNAAWARENGVDTASLYLVQGNSAERILSDAIKAMESGGVGLVVIDTVGQLIEAKGKTASWGEGDDKRRIGEVPKLVARFCRVASDLMAERDIAVVGVNQTYTKIGVMYGDPIETPGGKSWKFNLTMDMHVRRVEFLREKEGDPPVGIKIAVDVKKNKLGSLGKTDESNHLLFFFGENSMVRGEVHQLYDGAVRVGMLHMETSPWITWRRADGAEKKWQGKGRAIFDLMHDDDLRLEFAESLREALTNGPDRPVPPAAVGKPAGAARSRRSKG